MSGSWKGFGYCHGCQWWETTVSEHAFHRRCARGEESCLRESVLNYSLLNRLSSYRIFFGKYLASKNYLDLNVICINRLVWKLYVCLLEHYIWEQHLQSAGSGQRHRLWGISHLLPPGNIWIQLKYQTWTEGQMKVQDYFFFPSVCSLLQSLIEYP